MMKPLKIGPSYGVAFSANGGRLATVSRDVSIWDLAKRSKVTRAHPFSHPSSLDFSSDGTNLAVKSTSGRIVILSTASGETVIDFKNSRDGEGSDIRYSPCDKYLIDGTWSGFLSVRRAATGEREFLREFRNEMIRGVYRPNNCNYWVIAHQQRWTSGMPDDKPLLAYFSIWDWPFKVGGCRIFLENIIANDSAALTTDGALLAVTEDVNPKILSVYEVGTGIRLGNVPIETGGTHPALSWSPDKRFIGSVQNERIVFYDYPNLTKVSEVPLAFPSDVAFSQNGKVLAIGSWELGWALSTEELVAPHIMLKQTTRKRPVV